MRAAGAVASVVVLFVVGCQQSQPPTTLAPPPEPAAQTLKQEGDELARAHDWAGAVAKYQTALNQESASLEVRLALGVTLSHLDRRGETIEQFRWVMNHSQSGSPELTLARSWLVEAGEIEGPRVAIAAAERETPATVNTKDADTPKGAVQGATTWPGVNPRQQLIPLRITLSGEDKDNQGVNLGRRFRLGEGYRFTDALPGKYRLRAVAIDQNLELWDKTLVVEAGKDTVIDLTPADSRVSTKDFPPN